MGWVRPRGLDTAYDLQWLEILIPSGTIGVALMCAILSALGWRWLKMRKVADPAESALAGPVIVLANRDWPDTRRASSS
jgi:hypothetical protein